MRIVLFRLLVAAILLLPRAGFASGQAEHVVVVETSEMQPFHTVRYLPA